MLFAWGALALAAPWLVSAFDAKGDSADYLTFYCHYGVVAWLFLACLFVANTAFNNLGFPLLTMAFNLGPRDVGHDPSDLRRAVWRREGRSDRRRPWLRRVRRHRRRDGLCGDSAADESPGGAGAAMLRPARLRRRAAARVSAPICEALERRRRRGSVICNAAAAPTIQPIRWLARPQG